MSGRVPRECRGWSRSVRSPSFVPVSIFSSCKTSPTCFGEPILNSRPAIPIDLLPKLRRAPSRCKSENSLRASPSTFIPACSISAAPESAEARSRHRPYRDRSSSIFSAGASVRAARQSPRARSVRKTFSANPSGISVSEYRCRDSPAAGTGIA